MNARKLMGRLNAATVRFDIGRGGKPELTTEEVAGALAFVRDEIAREVFCAIWAPELARLARSEILARLREATLAEYCKRARALELARLELHIAECNAAAKTSLTIVDRKIRSTLRDELATARARHWPGEPAVYAHVCAAVMTELATSERCSECHGRGAYLRATLVVKCEHCGGTGMGVANDVQRAAWIGKLRTYRNAAGVEVKDASTYRQTWRPVYEWVRELAAMAEASAARKVAAALEREEEREAA